jgi:hypothetical protein
MLANFLRLCGEGDGLLLDRISGSFALAGFGPGSVASGDRQDGAPSVSALEAAAAAGRAEVVR